MVEGSRGNFFQYGENQRVAAGNFVIAEGWPGLILGGVMLGIMTGIIWRPRYRTFSLQVNSDGQRL